LTIAFLLPSIMLGIIDSAPVKLKNSLVLELGRPAIKALEIAFLFLNKGFGAGVNLSATSSKYRVSSS
jgi:hypothetical protein